MSRPSEPLLKLLRRQVDARGHNTASLAAKLGRPRGEVRRLLTGTDPMTLDDLLAITAALELSADDLGLPPVDEEALERAHEGEEPAQWRNHAEALFRMGYDLGIDFLFLVDVDGLDDDWGGPDAALDPYRGRQLPIQLLAAYHRYQGPEFDDHGVHITLSFDRLYRCTFPWHAIQRVVFDPEPPPPLADEDEDEDEAPPPKGPPHLRLV